MSALTDSDGYFSDSLDCTYGEVGGIGLEGIVNADGSGNIFLIFDSCESLTGYTISGPAILSVVQADSTREFVVFFDGVTYEYSDSSDTNNIKVYMGWNYFK